MNRLHVYESLLEIHRVNEVTGVYFECNDSDVYHEDLLDLPRVKFINKNDLIENTNMCKIFIKDNIENKPEIFQIV